MNELQRLIKEIKYKTNKTLDDIANDLGYDRAYLTDQVNKGKSQKIKGLLANKYKNQLKDFSARDHESFELHDDGDQEFKTKSKQSSTEKDVAIKALADIAESNKNNSMGILNTSAAIKSMAKSNEDLVTMLKSKMFSTEFEKNTMEATVATIAALREYTLDLAMSLTAQPRTQVEEEFYKKVGEQMDKIEHMGKGTGK